MAIKPKDIYRGTKKTHRATKILVAALALLVILSVSLFFGLRSYCIYDEDGNATLIMPFTKEAKALKEARKAQEAQEAQNETQPEPELDPEPDPEEDAGTDGQDAENASEPETTDSGQPESDTGEDGGTPQPEDSLPPEGGDSPE